MKYKTRATMIYNDGVIGGSYNIAVRWFKENVSHQEVLDEMWRWTQNIHDSWSRWGCQDNHPDISVLRPLERNPVTGQEMGFRSSMVGDAIQIDTYDDDGSLDTCTIWLVEPIGFREMSLEEQTKQQADIAATHIGTLI